MVLELRPDIGWRNLIKYSWRRDAVEEALREVPGLILQSPENQREFKLSYNVDPDGMPPISKIRALLREQKLSAHLIYSRQAYPRHFASACLQRTGNTLSCLQVGIATTCFSGSG